jgi:hypothetical protein
MMMTMLLVAVTMMELSTQVVEVNLYWDRNGEYHDVQCREERQQRMYVKVEVEDQRRTV